MYTFTIFIHLVNSLKALIMVCTLCITRLAVCLFNGTLARYIPIINRNMAIRHKKKFCLNVLNFVH